MRKHPVYYCFLKFVENYVRIHILIFDKVCKNVYEKLKKN